VCRSPVNDQEEKELLLAKMIFTGEQRLMDLESKAGAAKWELEKLDLDRQIHRRIMAGIEPAPSLLWLLRFWALPIFRRDGD